MPLAAHLEHPDSGNAGFDFFLDDVPQFFVDLVALLVIGMRLPFLVLAHIIEIGLDEISDC